MNAEIPGKYPGYFCIVRGRFGLERGSVYTPFRSALNQRPPDVERPLADVDECRVPGVIPRVLLCSSEPTIIID